MIKQEDQIKLIHKGLMSFLRENFLFWNNISIKELENITTGWETQIYAFNVYYTDEKGSSINKPMIIRIYRGKNGKSSAKSEYQTFSTIKQAGYSVPEIYGISLENEFIENPFLIMQKIEGKTLGALIRENPDKFEDYLIIFSQLFVKLHQIDWKRSIKDLKYFKDASKVFIKYFELLKKEIKHYNKTEFNPILEWLLNNIPESSANSENLAFIHKDFHPENILIDHQGYVFVIDWHGLEVMDYRFDLAWTLMLVETFESLDLRNAVFQMYEVYSKRELSDISFFEVAASLRRLLELSISISGNNDENGMKKDTLDMMKEHSNHFNNVYQSIVNKTKITLPEVEKLLKKLSD